MLMRCGAAPERRALCRLLLRGIATDAALSRRSHPSARGGYTGPVAIQLPATGPAPSEVVS